MTLQMGDLLAIGGIVLGSSLAVAGGALVCLKSDLRALRTETRAGFQDLRVDIRLLKAKVDALTQTILRGALVRGQLAPSLKLVSDRPQPSPSPSRSANARLPD